MMMHHKSKLSKCLKGNYLLKLKIKTQYFFLSKLMELLPDFVQFPKEKSTPLEVNLNLVFLYQIFFALDRMIEKQISSDFFIQYHLFMLFSRVINERFEKKETNLMVLKIEFENVLKKGVHWSEYKQIIPNLQRPFFFKELI